MNRNILFLLLIALAGAISCEQSATKTNVAPTGRPTVRELRHVVLFKFKDGLPADTIQAIEKAFAGLQKKIPTIRHFEWGVNNSPEQLAQGFTHCFVVTFANEKDRDEYLPNATHQAFVNTYAKPYVDKVCVVDFWASEE